MGGSRRVRDPASRSWVGSGCVSSSNEGAPPGLQGASGVGAGPQRASVAVPPGGRAPSQRLGHAVSFRRETGPGRPGRQPPRRCCSPGRQGMEVGRAQASLTALLAAQGHLPGHPEQTSATISSVPTPFSKIQVRTQALHGHGALGPRGHTAAAPWDVTWACSWLLPGPVSPQAPGPCKRAPGRPLRQ